jgi:S-adenosylmethionine:tRNA ribosyltransferase-isomerase
MHQPSDFHYQLDPDRIAQMPVTPRDSAKLMCLNRTTQTISHAIFSDLSQMLNSNDVLVINDSKVFPARLLGTKPSGGAIEILLLQPLGNDTWKALAKNIKGAATVRFSERLYGEILNNNHNGEIDIRLQSKTNQSIDSLIDAIGHTPIPPYIHSPLTESALRNEYQTVYAKDPGSAAAPTAGLHFTKELLTNLQTNGTQIERVTLHVGLGTFSKLKSQEIAAQKLHHEWYSITTDTAQRLNQAKHQGKRIIAVGTTSCRTLESASSTPGSTTPGLITPGSNQTDLFIMPPYQFKFTDALITNFHLPESSLLMLVTAFCSDSRFAGSLTARAYQTAIDHDYRFFSFGDAMLIE